MRKSGEGPSFRIDEGSLNECRHRFYQKKKKKRKNEKEVQVQNQGNLGITGVIYADVLQATYLWQ